MPTFSESTKQAFIVQSVRHQMLHHNAALGAGTTVTLLDQFAWVPRMGSVTPVEVDITYGISDDPSDEIVEFFIESVDIDNLPNIAALRETAIWAAAQAWRSIGTDAGPTQTLSRETNDIFHPATFIFDEVAGYTQRQAVALLAHSTTTSTLFVLAKLTWLETVVQRVWGSDTHDNNHEEREDWYYTMDDGGL